MNTDKRPIRRPTHGYTPYLFLSVLICGTLSVSSRAQYDPKPSNAPDAVSAPMPTELEGLEVIEHLGETLPMDLAFTDSQGNAVTLGDYFESGRPVVLNLGYYSCPMLCGLVHDGLIAATKEIAWTPGDQYDIVSVSIDPTETPKLAAGKKASTIAYLQKPEAAAGWHFLVGDEANTSALAEAVGFGYRYVPSQQQYAHAAVIMVINPDGSVYRYLYGITFDPQTLRLSLLEQAPEQATLWEQALMYCFHYDASTGQYSPVAMNIMRLGGGLTVAVIAGVIGLLLLREYLRRRRDRGARANLNSSAHATGT